jgi:hypothetical protein
MVIGHYLLRSIVLCAVVDNEFLRPIRDLVLKRFILTLISTVLVAGFATATAVEAHGRDRRVAAASPYRLPRTR